MQGLPKTYIYLGLITTVMFVVTALIQQRSIFVIYATLSILFSAGVVAFTYIKNRKNGSAE